MRYRHLKRTVIAVLAAIAFTLIIGTALRMVLEAGPTRRAAKRWIEEAAARSGAQLEIGDLHWGMLPPTIQLTEVQLEATGIGADIDFLEIELARVRLTTKTVELGSVAVRGVRLAVEGTPQPEAGDGGGLKVRIRRLAVSDISFEGVDLPGGLAVALDGLRAGWTTEAGASRGFAEVARAKLEVGRMAPFETALQARFVLSDGHLAISRYHLQGEGFDLTGLGYATADRKRIEAAGELDIDWLDSFIRTKGLLSGSADVSLVVDTTQPEILQADVRSRALRVSVLPMEEISGSVGFDGRSIRGTLDRARLHGGVISGDYRLDEVRNQFPHHIRLRGTGINLPDLLGDIKVNTAGLNADGDLSLEARWNGRRLGSGFGHADVQFHPAVPGLPVEGPLSVDLNGDGLLLFDAEDLAIGKSVARWQGGLTLGTWEPAWAIDARPAELSEIAPMVNRWVGSTVLPESLAGGGHLQVNLSGPFRSLAVTARIDARPLLLPPITIDHLVADATISGPRLRLESARFQIGDGFGEVNGGLAWGEDVADEQIDLEIKGRRIPMASVASWIDLDRYVDGGLVTFNGRLEGPIASPRGRWTIDLDQPIIAGLELGNASSLIELGGAQFSCSNLKCEGGLSADLSWDVTNDVVTGTMAWPNMPLPPFAETLTTLIGDSVDSQVDFRLPAAGQPSGTLVVAAEHGQVEFSLQADDMQLDAHIDDSLDASATLHRRPDGTLFGHGSLDLTSAGKLLDHFAPDAGVPIEGHGRAVFDVEWGDERWPHLDGTIASLELTLDDRPVRLVEPAGLSLSGRGLDVPGLRLQALEDELFVRWNIDETGQLRGNLSGTMDSLFLRFMLPTWEPAGRAAGIVEILGTVNEPRFEGIAEISGGSFRLPGTRTILSHVAGTVLLSSRSLQLDGMNFRIMGGRGRCTGGIRLTDDNVMMSLAGTASGIRFQVFPDLDARLSGDWRLNGPVDDLTLSGDLQVDRVSLSSRDALSSLLLRWLGTGGGSASQGGLNLALHVEADETIDLRSPFVRLTGSAALDVSGTTSSPGLVGQIDVFEGAEATILGNRFEIDRGSLTFSDPETIEPFLDLQASTFVQEYQVTMQLSGTFDRIVSTAVSTPPLSAPDIYSLLGVGYTGSSLGSSAMGLGLASSILSSELTSVFKKRGQMVLPVDQVRFDPFAADSTGNPTARLSVIKQLTPSWTVILQSTLDGEREQVVVSRWYIAPGLFIEAAQNADRSLSLDLKLRRPY